MKSFYDKTMSSAETYSQFEHIGIGVIFLPKEPSVQFELHDWKKLCLI